MTRVETTTPHSTPHPTTAAPAEPRPSGNGIGYLPGLDGLRAVSILAVLAYHLDAPWAAGGYLGVEVFFVISGYLITLLALDERGRTGSLARVRFWQRRARRLLPAVVALIAGVLAWSAVVAPAGELHRFRGDAVASLLYVQNWHAIISEQAYFAVFGRPSPFRHLWSLAIEEQFYLVWPLVLPWLWRLRSDRWVARVLLGCAALSVVAMAALADIAAPERAYYGTDTRAFGLLIGAALACVWHPNRARADVVDAARRTLTIGGITALGLLLWQLAGRSEFDAWTYPWGFLWVDVLTVVAIVAATHPGSAFAIRLGAPWLTAVGRRSYSLYLWHWPVIVFTRPGVDWGHEGFGALFWRVVLIFGLSELSYRWVEQPFRDGRVQRRWDNLRIQAARQGWWAPAAVATTAVAVVAVWTVVGAEPAETRAARAPDVTIAAPTAAAPTTAAVPTTATPPTTTVAPTTPISAPPTTAAPRPVPDVTVIGESVTLGGAPRLQEWYGARVQIDAVEGRSFNDGVARVETLAAEGLLTPYVIVHMGNNGAVPAGGLDRVVAAVGPDRRLLLVSVRVPRNWETQVNGEIWGAIQRHANVDLIDWHRVANSEPGLLTDDGVHLTDAGEERYAALLAAATP